MQISSSCRKWNISGVTLMQTSLGSFFGETGDTPTNFDETWHRRQLQQASHCHCARSVKVSAHSPASADMDMMIDDLINASCLYFHYVQALQPKDRSANETSYIWGSSWYLACMMLPWRSWTHLGEHVHCGLEITQLATVLKMSRTEFLDS